MRDLTRVIDQFRTGNQRTPTLSLRIDQLIRDAWVLASIQYRASKIRSGVLLLALLDDEELGRLARDASRELAKIDAAVLKANLMKLVAGSAEDEGPVGRGRRRRGGPGRTPAGVSQTPALDQYTINLTERARKGEIDPVIGREAEVRQMVDILIRRRQNNPILTGEAGVGKTAVVEGLALRIAQGDVPPVLKNVVLRTLDLGLLQAGAGVKGEFENRLKQVIAEVKASPDADHPVHRRGPHHDRRRRPGRPERRRQPAQAGPGPRRAAHDRRHHLGRVQEVLREGRRPGAAVPGRQGRGARRGPRHPDDARDHRDAGEAPRRADPRRGGRGRGQALAPLHPGPPAAGQVGQPARHRLRRVAIGQNAIPPAIEDCRRRIEHLKVEIGILDREGATGGQHAERMAEVQQALDEDRARLAALEARWEDETEARRGDPRPGQDDRGPLPRGEEEGDRLRRRVRRSSPPPSWPPCRPSCTPRSTPSAPSRANRRFAGLRRRPDHRRGDRRLDGHPRRQDARRRDPDGAQSPGEAGGARHRPVARPRGDRPADPDRARQPDRPPPADRRVPAGRPQRRRQDRDRAWRWPTPSTAASAT